MTKFKYLIIGVIIGTTIMSITTIFAAVEWVKAYQVDNVSFRFGEVFKAVPEDQPTLIYNDRTYVSARFVAENLGAKVEWNEVARVVTFTPPEPVVEEKIVYVEVEKETENKAGVEEKETDVTYTNLPVSKNTQSAQLTIENIFKYTEHTRVTLEMKNTSQSYQTKIKYFNITMNVDGVEYTTRDAPDDATDENMMDVWSPEEKRTGYITFPKIPENAKNATLKLSIVRLDDKPEDPEVVEFNFKVQK